MSSPITRVARAARRRTARIAKRLKATQRKDQP